MSILVGTLRSGGRLVRDCLLAGEMASRPGLIQGLEPRVKLLSTLLFIATAISLKSLYTLLVLVGVLLVLAYLSKIPLGLYFRRTWFFIPIFSAAVALPAPFLTPGVPLIAVNLWAFRLSASLEGTLRALKFVLRVYLCVSAMLLLVYTTRFSDIMDGLSGLYAPKALIYMLSIAYRYVFLFLDELLGVLMGWEGRMVGRQKIMDLWRGGTTGVALLLIRAYERGERVYLAMKSRGYEGTPKTHAKRKPQLPDYLYISASIILCMVLLVLDFGFFTFLCEGSLSCLPVR